MSMDAVSLFDGDIRLVTNFLECPPHYRHEVLKRNVEILKFVDELCSGSRGYRRHRQTALKNRVYEVCSGRRVIEALKLLPGLDLVCGYWQYWWRDVAPLVTGIQGRSMREPVCLAHGPL